MELRDFYKEMAGDVYGTDEAILANGNGWVAEDLNAETTIVYNPANEDFTVATVQTTTFNGYIVNSTVGMQVFEGIEEVEEAFPTTFDENLAAFYAKERGNE